MAWPIGLTLYIPDVSLQDYSGEILLWYITVHSVIRVSFSDEFETFACQRSSSFTAAVLINTDLCLAGTIWAHNFEFWFLKRLLFAQHLAEHFFLPNFPIYNFLAHWSKRHWFDWSATHNISYPARDLWEEPFLCAFLLRTNDSAVNLKEIVEELL